MRTIKLIIENYLKINKWARKCGYRVACLPCLKWVTGPKCPLEPVPLRTLKIEKSVFYISLKNMSMKLQ